MCVVCCKGTMNGVSRSLLLKCMYGTISSKSCYTAYILPLYSAFSWWHSDFVGDNHFSLFFYLCYLAQSAPSINYTFVHTFCTRCLYFVCEWNLLISLLNSFTIDVSHVVNVCFIHWLFAVFPFLFLDLSVNTYITLAAFHCWDWHRGHCRFLWSLELNFFISFDWRARGECSLKSCLSLAGSSCGLVVWDVPQWSLTHRKLWLKLCTIFTPSFENAQVYSSISLHCWIPTLLWYTIHFELRSTLLCHVYVSYVCMCLCKCSYHHHYWWHFFFSTLLHERELLPLKVKNNWVGTKAWPPLLWTSCILSLPVVLALIFRVVHS